MVSAAGRYCHRPACFRVAQAKEIFARCAKREGDAGCCAANEDIALHRVGGGPFCDRFLVRPGKRSGRRRMFPSAGMRRGRRNPPPVSPGSTRALRPARKEEKRPNAGRRAGADLRLRTIHRCPFALSTKDSPLGAASERRADESFPSIFAGNGLLGEKSRRFRRIPFPNRRPIWFPLVTSRRTLRMVVLPFVLF